MSKVSFSRLLIAIAVLAALPCKPVSAELAIHIHADKAMFQVLMSRGNVGTDSFVLQLMDGEGNLLKAREATLTLSLPGRGIEPFERAAMLGGGLLARWRRAGRWHVRVDALVTDFERITLEDEFDVPAR